MAFWNNLQRPYTECDHYLTTTTTKAPATKPSRSLQLQLTPSDPGKLSQCFKLVAMD